LSGSVQKGGISKSANVRSNRNECFSNNNKFTTRLKAPPWRNFFYGGAFVDKGDS
jgi:hypothetical protein